MPSPSSAYIIAYSSSLSLTSPDCTPKSSHACSSTKTDGSSCVLAWLIAGVLLNIFIVAPFFFWWHWAVAAWELKELEVTRCTREVELHVQLGDRSVAMVFKVVEAS
jgi:hypothetical protein